MQKLINLFSGISKYVAAAILIIIPLYPKFPFLKIFGSYVAIRIEDFILALVAIVTIIKLIPRIKELFAKDVVRYMGIFVLVGFVSLFSAVFLTKTAILSVGILHLLRRVEYFIPFFFVLAFFNKQDLTKNIEFLLKVLMLVIFLVFIYGIGEIKFKFPIIVTQNMEYSKGIALDYIPGSQLNSTFAGHYDLSGFLVLTLPIVWAIFAIEKNKLSKIILLIVISCGLWLMGQTASRISAVAYVLASSASLFILKKYKYILGVFVISGVFFLASPGLLGRYGQILKVYFTSVPVAYAKDEVESLLATPSPAPVVEDRSTSIRLKVEWPRAIRSLEKNPLLGTGYSSINLATDNDYLRMLGETGLLGFFAFMLILTGIARDWINYLRRKVNDTDLVKAFMAGIIGSFVGVLINITFIDLFEASKFAIIFWLLIGISYKIANE